MGFPSAIMIARPRAWKKRIATCRRHRRLRRFASRRSPYLAVVATPGLVSLRTPIPCIKIGRITKPTITSTPRKASISFWFLRNTLNGLAMVAHPSLEGGPPAKFHLTNEPAAY